MKIHVLIIILLTLLGSSIAKPILDPNLKQRLLGFRKCNIMVTLACSTHTVLEPLQDQEFPCREDRLNAVANALKSHAKITQSTVLRVLSEFDQIEISPYWISNQIFIKGADSSVIAALEVLPDISKIEEEFFIHLETTESIINNTVSSTDRQGRQGGVNTWGVSKIHAPDVWRLGYRGQGILIASIDTGVRGSHSAFRSRYIGQYGWFDPSGKTTSPNDNNGHGTHTMGTMVGSGGIGVAPYARWMACKGCADNTCSSNDLTACAQFIQCPTLPDGTNPNCARAPWIVSNSWGGGQGATWFNDIVNAWHTAGIIPVFSVGNSGPDCGSANSPGDQPNLIAVGATDSSDTLASFSSVGPTTTGAIKPDVVAPGYLVKSSINTGDNSYLTLSGTSMACPHVSGVIALMKSKNHNLSYNDVYKYITESAVRSGLTGSGENCGGISESSEWPNNSFGYGRLNALQAINQFSESL